MYGTRHSNTHPESAVDALRRHGAALKHYVLTRRAEHWIMFGAGLLIGLILS